MGNGLKKVWYDPVWSKVIAGVILALGGVLWSFVKGLVNNGESIPEALSDVFGFKVNVWIVIAIILAVLIVVSLVKRKNDISNRAPITPFREGFVGGVYQGQKWKWRWQWSETDKVYHLMDLNLVCPQCKEGLLTVGYSNYSCGKCGIHIPFRMMGANYEAVANQILADSRSNYSNCAQYIGEYK